MKHLLALMALCVAFAAGAQTGLVEFPYNPDADNDDVIGTEDLLALLSLYGTIFSEEGTYLSADSMTALHYTGERTIYRCRKSCSDLPGRWRLPTFENMCNFELSELAGGSYAWIDNRLPGANLASQNLHRSIRINQYTDTDHGKIETWYRDEDDVSCFCYTHERPKVEYSYCRDSDEGGDPTPFAICAQEKAQDGWYPLGGMSSFPFNGVDYNSQAFWRWAE